MRLINKNKGTPFADVGAYVCELTDELDALAKTVSDASVNRPYILADEFCKRNKCLAIRIPGCTLGGIHYNHDNIVTGIEINTDCMNKIYLLNAKELVNKYIGDKIEFAK